MSIILVVDDMAVFREPISAALQLRGHQTFTAAEGRDALRLTREHHPDLVLLDLAMPTMDGVAFLEAMRNDPSIANTRVILLTASQDKNLLMKTIRLGARDVLLKSQFSLDELVRRIGRQLEANASTPHPSTKGTKPASMSGNAAATKESPTADDSATAVAAVPREAAAAALKSLKPLLTRSELDEVLEQFGELQAMSPAVSKVLALSGSSTCSMDQVAKAVKQDHAIALKIIKLANSALYTRGEPVESVEKAVARIGLSQIRQAVLNIAVIDGFSGSGIEQHLSTPLFWEHSIACALISAEITRSLGGKEADIDAASTMGLLHDVGRMVYAKALGERYCAVLETADRLQLPLEQVESRMLLANHADVMDKLLHNWKFPPDLINPIALHHLSIGNIRRMSPHTVQQCAVLALADTLAHAMLLGSSGNTAIYPTLPFIQALRLSDDVVRSIEADVPMQTTNLKLALLSRSPSVSWPQLNRTLREQLPADFSPRFVGVYASSDAFRMLCDALPVDQPRSANVILAHVGHVREREEVSNLVLEAEANMEQHLPMIIVSPNANIALSDRAMAGRRVQMLGTPLHLGRLVSAAHALLAKGSEYAA